MRILQLANRLPYPLNDGGNIATYHVTEYLHQFGHHVTLAALNTNKHYTDPKALAPIAEVHTIDIDTTVKPTGALSALFGSLPYNIARFQSEEFSALLLKLLKANSYDIIQIEGLHMCLYLPVIRKLTQTPVILRAHNVEHQLWERMAENEDSVPKKLYRKMLAWQIRQFEQKTARLLNGIVAITENDADYFRKVAPHVPVVSIAAGVHIPPAIPSLKELKPSVCMLGSLEWLPNVQGLHWFLEGVWYLVKEALPDAELHVAGKNPSEELMKIQAPGLVMHGMVDDAQAFLLQHPVLAVPLSSGGGMRLKVVEAMALGRCVVSTSIGAEGIEAEPGKHLLIADTEEEFAQAVIQALTDLALRARIGMAAAEQAKKFYSWEALVRQFELFYGTLLS